MMKYFKQYDSHVQKTIGKLKSQCQTEIKNLKSQLEKCHIEIENLKEKNRIKENSRSECSYIA